MSTLRVDNITGRLDDTTINQPITFSANTATLSSAVVFPAGTMCGFTETTTTPTSAQGGDTTYTDMTGSSVSYTPVTSSSFVVYEYSTFFVNSNNNSLIFIKFFYDGSEVGNTNHGWYSKFDDGDAGLGYQHWTFILPSWSGSKDLKMQYRINSSYAGRFHQSSYSGEVSGTDVYTKIYRRTYSVM